MELVRDQIYRFSSSRDILGSIVSFEDYCLNIGPATNVEFSAKFIKQTLVTSLCSDGSTEFKNLYYFDLMYPGLEKYQFCLYTPDIKKYLLTQDKKVLTVDDLYI
jgi:hypothetical protein